MTKRDKELGRKRDAIVDANERRKEKGDVIHLVMLSRVACANCKWMRC